MFFVFTRDVLACGCIPVRGCIHSTQKQFERVADLDVLLSSHQQYRQFHIVGRHVPTDAMPDPQVYRMKLWSTDDTRAKSKFWCVLSPSFGPIGSDARRERGEWASAWRPGGRSAGPSQYFDVTFF